jgi:FkbM family methyltransferase
MLRKKLKSGLYRLARKMRPILPYGILENLAQWLTRYVYDADFKVFDWLADTPGLVMDVGAHRGSAALSVLRRTRRMKVFSVEPNRTHRWGLLLILMLHPGRFRYRLVAAGAEAARKILFVPGRRGSGLSPHGSLDPSEFEKGYIRDRLAESGFDTGNKAGFRQLEVRVVPLDHFDLSPDFIKLDIEGFELQALEGLEKTLTNLHPALLIEINNPERWMSFLLELGYEFYVYDVIRDALTGFDRHQGELNLFCLHRDSNSEITRILLDNVKTAPRLATGYA